MTQSPTRAQIYLAFALVYVFWGSTYLAIAISVRHFPAALMTGLRFSVAGPLMLLWCAATKRRLRITRYEFVRLLAISLLLLTGGNMVLAWTEKIIPSGLASLFVAGVPIYIAVVEGFILRGDRVQGRGWIGILLGMAGLVLLLWPKLENPTQFGRAQLVACLVVICGSISWSCGSILSRRSKITVDPLVATGWEMTFAGVVNMTLAAAFGDFKYADWSRAGLTAIAYLVVFGSWIGFTAYIYLLEHVPTPKVATYAYVNPIVAVFLGMLILHEKLDTYSIMGMIVIVAAVALVTSSKLRRGEGEASQELVPCEAEA